MTVFNVIIEVHCNFLFFFFFTFLIFKKLRQKEFSLFFVIFTGDAPAIQQDLLLYTHPQTNWKK